MTRNEAIKLYLPMVITHCNSSMKYTKDEFKRICMTALKEGVYEVVPYIYKLDDVLSAPNKNVHIGIPESSLISSEVTLVWMFEAAKNVAEAKQGESIVVNASVGDLVDKSHGLFVHQDKVIEDYESQIKNYKVS